MATQALIVQSKPKAITIFPACLCPPFLVLSCSLLPHLNKHPKWQQRLNYKMTRLDVLLVQKKDQKMLRESTRVGLREGGGEEKAGVFIMVFGPLMYVEGLSQGGWIFKDTMFLQPCVM